MTVPVLRQMERLKVEVILGERIDMRSIEDKKSNQAGERMARTTSGRDLTADFIVGYLYLPS